MTPSPDDPTTLDGSARRDAVRRGYDDLAAAYDDARQPDRVERESLDALHDRLDASCGDGDEPSRLLDAGCGAGRCVLERIAGANEIDAGNDAASDAGNDAASDAAVDAVGLDISREQARLASAFAPVVHGDMTRLPFADERFDAVTAFHSTIHVPTAEHPTLYGEFARVLRPGGWLLVTVGDDAWEGTNEDWLDAGAAMHWSFPAMAETRASLADAGFSVEREWTSEDELGGGEWPVLLCRLADGSALSGDRETATEE